MGGTWPRQGRQMIEVVVAVPLHYSTLQPLSISIIWAPELNAVLNTDGHLHRPRDGVRPACAALVWCEEGAAWQSPCSP